MNTMLKHILQAAHYAPSADNSQPWRFEWQNSTLSVCYDSSRVSNNTFSFDNPATILAMGAVLENVQQAAFAADWQISLEIPDSLEPSRPIYFKAKFDMQTQNKSDILDSLPLCKRHTNRLPYLSEALSQEVITQLYNLTYNSARVIVFAQQGDIQNLIRLVRMASEIRFRTREVHEWLGKSFRFDKASVGLGDGLDVATLNLPVGGKCFLRLIADWNRMKLLNYLGFYKLLSLIDVTPIKQAPAVVAILGPNLFKDTLYAGQLMERIWIDLNNQGIAVQPYYVISDQLQRYRDKSVPRELMDQASRLVSQTQDFFQINSDETVHMLFRIGYPKKPPVLSKRLPLQKVCSMNIE